MRLFVDTSAWIGLEDSRDQWHPTARAFSEGVLFRAPRLILVTSNFVLHETCTLMKARRTHDRVIEFLDATLASPGTEVVRVDEELEEDAWAIFRRYAEHPLSFTDCTSFALMRREKLRQAFTFDEHFRMFGFETLPAPS